MLLRPAMKHGYRNFDFEQPSALFNALDSLRVEVPELPTEEKTDHLEPLIKYANNSTSTMGRLTEHDIAKLRELGRCTHNRLLVLLLEPTGNSDETIQCIDHFLQWASCGSLNRSNTAIINCRTLIPNASFTATYRDDSPYVPDSISSCSG
jgi:hypothetical protein